MPSGFGNKNKLYSLTAGDRAIFDGSEDDGNIFTNYYLRTLHKTGTMFRHDDERHTSTYKKLHEMWVRLGKPKYFGFDGRWHEMTRGQWELANAGMEYPCYRMTEDRKSGKPFFFWHHGFQYQPVQMEFRNHPASVKMVTGGFGSGKSVTAVAMMLEWAAKLEGFIGFVLAPYNIQVQESFRKALDFLRDSIYADRFLIRVKRQPPYELIIGNDLVGENVIRFIPVLDDPEKVKNLEGDIAIIEQAEQFPDILTPATGLLAMVSSRLRGFDYASGRERLAQTLWIANSSDNPEWWMLTEREAEDAETYKHFLFSTFDNQFISKKQLKNFMAQFGRTEEEAEVNLRGGRPTGRGLYFSGASVRDCGSKDLSELIELGLSNGVEGYHRESMSGVGYYAWEIPYEKDGTYMVFADPGWGNPPKRNAPAMGVFRVDGFPEYPAEMVAFHWLFADGKPDSWIRKFVEMHMKYKIAPEYGFYDATGPQSGYEQMDAQLKALGAIPVSVTGQLKDTGLTLLRLMINRQYFNWADEIMGIPRQLTRYEVPDKKLDQDIVMMLMVGALALQPKYQEYVRKLELDEQLKRERIARMFGMGSSEDRHRSIYTEAIRGRE